MKTKGRRISTVPTVASNGFSCSRLAGSDLISGVNIRTSGAVFEDGSVIKWVEPWEVDATGIYRYRMLTAPGRTSVACHTITMYDGAETVGVR
jgi:hypothetical protein